MAKRKIQLSGPTYRKDVIRTGRFWVPRLKAWLNVTRERMDLWCNSFKAMRDTGVECPLTIDHEPKDSAEAQRGDILKLEREGDELFATVQVADDDSRKLVERCPNVSAEIEGDVTDGNGHTYEEAITAITVALHPVVTGQRPFRKIAASRGTHSAWSLSLSADMTAEPNGASAMTPEQLAEMCRLLNVATDGTPADQAMAILEAIKKLTGAGGKGGAGAGEEEGKKALEGMKAELSRVTVERDAAKAALTAKAAPEIDADALDMAADGVGVRLSRLVDTAKLTPAARAKLEPILLGTNTKRPAIMLSRKAAVAAGIDAPLANAILAALEDNDALTLAKMLGDKAVVLSRKAPGQNPNEEDPAVLLKRMAEAV